MQITKITGENCKRTKSLWEEVFSEDSKEFTDYYFEHKAKKNIGYVIGEEPYNAMMFRTPYPLQIADRQQEISYLVGVATRQEYRHKGYMTALIMTALQDMYKGKNPFTFLMPANPAIYEPFDFKYIYERPVWKFREENFPVQILEPLMGTGQKLEIRAEQKQQIFLQAEQEEKILVQIEAEGESIGQAEQEEEIILRAAEYRTEESISSRAESIKANSSDRGNTNKENQRKETYTIKSLRGMIKETNAHLIFQDLADFANNWLSSHYNIYVHRDASYYELQLTESIAQNGDIFILYQDEEIKGFFLYAREGEEIFVQEVMETQKGMISFLQEEARKKPIIMARIVHLEEMMKSVRSSGNRNVLIEIEDDLIPENDGLYRWEITPMGSMVTRIKEPGTAEVFMHIRELTEHLFSGVFLNEIV